MTAAVLEAPPISEVSTAYDFEGTTPPNRKRWTRDDCDFMERSGILTERYELLDGEIISKMGQDLPHAIGISLITFYLMQTWGPTRVFTQTSLEVLAADGTRNRPEPDAYVVSRSSSNFTRVPVGSDLLLAVEVSNSTLKDDLHKKADLYARAGVPEYWVLDVVARRLHCHRDPVDGRYTDVQVRAEVDTIAHLSAPTAEVRVADLLPPSTL